MTLFAWFVVAWWLFCQAVWSARWWAWYHPDFDSRLAAKRRRCA